MPEEELPTSTTEGDNPENQNENDEWRRALLVLLFLLFSFVCLFCASQSAFYFIDREKVLGDMRSQQRADYGPGVPIVLAPLDKESLLTAIFEDEEQLTQTPQSTVIVAAVPLPGLTAVAQIPTIVPPIPTLTPTPTATPTLEPTSSPVPPTTAPSPTSDTPIDTVEPPVPTNTVAPPLPTNTVAPPLPTPTYTAVPPLPTPTNTAVSSGPTPTDTSEPSGPTPTDTSEPPGPTPTDTPVPNEPPDVQNDSMTIAEDSGPVTFDILGNDNDPDGSLDPATVTIISGPAHGTAQVNPDGSITYTPNHNFFGTDTIVYEVCDNEGDCDTATVTIIVTPVNDRPVAVNDPFVVTDEGMITSTNVVTNDHDPEGDPLTIVSMTNPPHGTVVTSSAHIVVYTPDPLYFGTDTFTYTISDGALTDRAAVTVTIRPIISPPVAVPDVISTAEDTEEDIGVLANDFDLDGDPLDIVAVGAPLSGTVSINGSVIHYTPFADISGTDTFTYTISDGIFNATSTVTVHIIPINDSPNAGDDNYTGFLSSQPLVVDAPGVLSNDSDVENSMLKAVLVPPPPSSGVLDLSPSGAFTYTAVATGTFSFTYQAIDTTSGVSNIAVVTLQIDP